MWFQNKVKRYLLLNFLGILRTLSKQMSFSCVFELYRGCSIFAATLRTCSEPESIDKLCSPATIDKEPAAVLKHLIRNLILLYPASITTYCITHQYNERPWWCTLSCRQNHRRCESPNAIQTIVWILKLLLKSKYLLKLTRREIW